MNRDAEILRFQTLMRRSELYGEDLGQQLHEQMVRMEKAGISGAEINHLLHDRHSRANLQVSPPVAPRLMSPFGKRRNPYETDTFRVIPVPKSREELAREYQATRQNFGSRPPPPPELRVPYGLDKGRALVAAAKAVKGKDYHCPGCNAELVLRAGGMKVQHFAHQAHGACSEESVAHQVAKILIGQAIIEHADTASPVQIKMDCQCSSCDHRFSRTLPKDAFSDADIERVIGAFRCDVVGLREESVVLAIEVSATNPVHKEKGAALSVPWIEVRAEAILANPYHWQPVQSRLRSVVCPACQKSARKLFAIAEKWKLPMTRGAASGNPGKSCYLAAAARCWKCHEEILWYWWRGVPFCEAEPPQPAPPTVQLRRSKAYGKQYWANCCPNCNAIQGDNFVFIDKSSPLANLPQRELPVEKALREQNNAYVVGKFMEVVDRIFGK